jgi:hypothetical protein
MSPLRVSTIDLSSISYYFIRDIYSLKINQIDTKVQYSSLKQVITARRSYPHFERHIQADLLKILVWLQRNALLGVYITIVVEM